MVKDSEKRDYELSFVLKNKEGESSIESLLKQYSAEVFYKAPATETRLAYAIKKQTQAYFGYLQFRVVPDAVDKIMESLKLNPAVLRSLVVVPPVLKESKIKQARKDEVVVSRRKLSEPTMPVAPSGVLSNEALEEKLEEILK